jgi:tetratricopeptide (TPR) repeat protein
VEYFERAIAVDPDYAMAWAGLAFTLAGSAINGDAAPLEVGPKARQASAEAVRANDGLAETHHALGYVSWSYDWNWPAAEAALRNAVALDPYLGPAQRTLGHVLSQMGRHAEAQRALRRARELDPMSALTHALSSQVAFQARDYRTALEHARNATVIDPDLWIGLMMAGQAHTELGEVEAAMAALSTAIRYSNRNSKPFSLMGYLLARAGRFEEANEVLASLEATAAQRYVPPYALALVQAGLGDREQVFAWLERAYAVRDVHLIYLPVDAKWDPYRDDPRFRVLLERCNFLGPGGSGSPPLEQALPSLLSDRP